ncbi:MAG: radical SAM protein [Candidatus Nezhaarchaeales archaeon]
MNDEVRGMVEQTSLLLGKKLGSKPSWIASHPCFNPKANFRYSRLHLPVAPKCNIQCKYCGRGISKFEYGPGVTSSMIKPEEAVRLVDEIIKIDRRLRVVAIAGPGEPLFNNETFTTLKLIDEKYPDIIKCIATNGLLLQEKVADLKNLGVKTITITINALDPVVASKIYDFIILDKRIMQGLEAAKTLIERQLKGLRTAVDEGLIVKVNTVLIPRLNDREAVKVAKKVAELGAFVQNIIPLIPLSSFKDYKPPTCEELKAVRKKASKFINQFKLCRQCRADSYGIPGLEKASMHEIFQLNFHA